MLPSYSGRKRGSFNRSAAIGTRSVKDDGKIQYLYSAKKRNRPEGFDSHAARKRKKLSANLPAQETRAENKSLSINFPSTPDLEVCNRSHILFDNFI